MEHAGDGVGLRRHRGEQPRGRQPDAEARLEEREADDERVPDDHGPAEPAQATAGASGSRRRREDRCHGHDDGHVVQSDQLVRRPGDAQEQPGEPEHCRQRQVLGRERQGIAHDEDEADAGEDDESKHDAEEEGLGESRRRERRAEQGEQRQRDGSAVSTALMRVRAMRRRPSSTSAAKESARRIPMTAPGRSVAAAARSTVSAPPPASSAASGTARRPWTGAPCGPRPAASGSGPDGGLTIMQASYQRRVGRPRGARAGSRPARRSGGQARTVRVRWCEPRAASRRARRR